MDISSEENRDPGSGSKRSRIIVIAAICIVVVLVISAGALIRHFNSSEGRSSSAGDDAPETARGEDRGAKRDDAPETERREDRVIERYETEAILRYTVPDRADRSKTLDPKLVLDILQRSDTHRDFRRKIGDTDANRCWIRLEAIETNRRIDRFQIIVTGPEERTAVAVANAFAQHCVDTYVEEHTAMLKKQREQLEEYKREVIREISQIEEEKKQLCEGRHIPDPQTEFKRLQRAVGDTRQELDREIPELEAKRREYAELEAKCRKFDPALVENAVELRKRIEARTTLDAEVERYESEYLDTNPKLINIRERRAAMETAFQKFLKDKNISERDLDRLDLAVLRHAELDKLGAELKLKEEKVRMYREQLRADEEKLYYLREVMPQIDKLNELQRTRRESLNKLIASISEIDSMLPTIKDNMRIEKRAEQARLRRR